ncbi:Fc.00g050150.m01.CDS01 [Cosmosporella sp. VM-42]
MSTAQFLVINDLNLPGSSKRVKPTVQPRKKTDATAKVNSRGSRSRSGCITCRAKHSKCDETKPECLMCTQKGVKCGGYRKQLRWSYKHEVKTNSQYEDQSQQYSTSASAGTSTSGKRPGTHRGSASASQRSPISATQRSPMSTASMPIVPEFDAGAMSWGMMPESLISEFGQYGVEPSFSPQHNLDNISDPSAEVHSMTGYSPRSSFSLPVSDTQLSSYSRGNTDYLPDDAPTFDLTSAHEYIPPTITHIPSLLISHWFRDVCPVWSAYDSHMNLNRTMATALWPDSEAVSTSLQSMSAAFLATRIPYMKQTSLFMMKSATKAINKELAATKCFPRFEAVPMSLLFALFCIGTTICWLDATQLGIPFLKEVKILLDRVNRQQDMLCDEDRKLLKFFNKSWIYCDMLLAVVSSEYGQIEAVEDSSSDEGSPTCDVEPTRADTDEMPHPWTGISTTASRLFTSAVRLCRDFRRNMNNRHQGVTAQDLRAALQQLEEAPKIEEQLLRLEYESMPHANLGDTGDQNTPCTHLVKVAEAYRLAALLHLYQTFPDLVALRLPDSSTASRTRQVPWDDWIVPLTLRLVKILEQLPPGSGSRMVQPLLCITASTGLRLNIPKPPRQRVSSVVETPIVIQEELCDMTEYISRLTEADDVADASGLLTQTSLDVGNARHFVLQRLNILETILPPKPIIMAKNLVQAIWAAYDEEEPGANSVHWVDVMGGQNLRSFFG